MSRISEKSYEEKMQAVAAFLSGRTGCTQLAREHDVDENTVRAWVRLYETFGEEGLRNHSFNREYCPELKREAVQAYLSGEGSLMDITKRFKLSSHSQLIRWIKLYNGHIGFRSPRGHGSEMNMTKGRTTTREERIEIVGFCIENGKDYAQTIVKYGVSYPQIYSWVKKYEVRGAAGLEDKRGKRKDISAMTETERLKAENHLLQARLRHSEMENLLLKKLEELERRGY
jgi:transposase